ncbi:MAG: DedA family protein [Chloroflexota bacterium]|nr:MAG: DedA family protein [Chloroflexota bacterium]HDD61315.1 DedA family protein [Chloroflexota bacterium]
MEVINFLIDFILHMDVHLNEIISNYGVWTYGILFFVIFMETGFVVTPFLPGDSLLFAAGTFAALGSLNPYYLFLLLTAAAILGDTVNYSVGHYIGPRAFSGEIKFLKQEHLDKTQAFYKKHGGKTIILARFIPIIRTFAPFVAGIGTMKYRKFITYNIVGGIAWVATFTFLGYFFGNIEFVKKNFELVIFAIIFISFIPPILEVIKARKEAREAAKEVQP